MERLGVVESMAFSSSGDELWLCHPHAGLAVRRWPSLELLVVHDVHCRGLVAHPDGLFAAIDPTSGAIVVEGGRVVQRLHGAIARPGSVGFHESGNLWTLRVVRNDLVARRVEPSTGDVVVERTIALDHSFSQWMTCVLGTVKLAFVAMNDRAAVVVDLVGDARPAVEWAAGFDIGRSTWLSVDASADERSVVYSDKMSATRLLRLDDMGRLVSVTQIEKRAYPHPTTMKRPARGAVHAIHPFDGTLCFTDIVGRFFVADTTTGQLLREPAVSVGTGYRWE